MAVQVRANPTLPNTARSFNGKSVSQFTITPLTDAAAAVDFTDELGPNGALQLILRTITQAATPVMISAAADIEAPVYTVFFEGDFNITDTWDGTNNESFADYLQRLIQGLGEEAAARVAGESVGPDENVNAGVDLRGTTVAFNALFQADQINV